MIRNREDNMIVSHTVIVLLVSTMLVISAIYYIYITEAVLKETSLPRTTPDTSVLYDSGLQRVDNALMSVPRNFDGCCEVLFQEE